MGLRDGVSVYDCVCTCVRKRDGVSVYDCVCARV